MIRIQNVNKKQQKMLDIMWSFQDVDELEAWKKTLKPKSRHQAETLEQLILLATLDEMIDEEDDFEEANEIIDRIMSRV